MNPRLRPYWLVLVATLLVLAVNGALGLYNLRRVMAAQEWVVHTREVMENLDAVRATLVDAESGQRGYIITGVESYLDPYHTAVAELRGRLDRLGELVRDNPEQSRQLAALRPIVDRRVEVLQEIIRLRSRGDDARGFALARERLLNGQGKLLMDQFRARAEEMSTHERRLLAERERSSTAALRTALGTGLLGLAASLFLVGALFTSLRRGMHEREEAAAREAWESERMRTTLASIGDAVIVTDEIGRIILLNPMASGLLGWDGDAVGRQLDEVFRIVHEETREAVESPVDKVLRLGTVVGLANHTVVVTREGRDVPIDDSGAPIRDASGRVLGVVLVFRDVRARRKTERLLAQQAQELAESNQRKDEFLAMLGHELRNPLAPLLSAVEVIRLRGITDGRALEVIARQTRHMKRLIDDLLDVARVTRGKIELQMSAVDLVAVVRQAAEASQSLDEGHGRHLELHLPPDPIPLRADATRMAQVIGNLLSNAFKYSAPGGRIELSVERRGREAEVRVRDDGIGMAPELVPRVFEPFTQADRSLARSQGGLGIGLTIVRSLVELHGGEVEARSEGKGRGSEFVVKLPIDAHRVEGRPAAEVAPQPHEGSAIRVLVVDDNEDSALQLADLLGLWGMDSRAVFEGRSALDSVESFHPDVVLLDLGLPGLSGFDVARAIRDRHGPSHPVVAAVTGYGQSDDRARTREAGFQAHFTKPVELDALRNFLLAHQGGDTPKGGDTIQGRK